MNPILGSYWNKCWMRECIDLINQEWSCGRTDVTNPPCEIPYQTVLHQVRNPMRNLESLVVKFCIGGLNGTVQPAFAKYTAALFPPDSRSMAIEPDIYLGGPESSCIEMAGYFLVQYNTQLVQARTRGEIQALYHVEESSPCHVAEMAGLMNPETTVYHPNHEKVLKKCQNGDASAVVHQPMKSTRNKINKGQVKLGWSDLRGGVHGSRRANGDRTLELMVRQLFETLGYNAALESELVEQPGASGTIDSEF